MLIVGTLGCLVGLSLYYWKWSRRDRRIEMWTTALLNLALLCGVVGIFRYQAGREAVMWTKVNMGFVRAMTAAQDEARDGTSAGIQMTLAGADIQAAIDMGGPEFGTAQYQKLSSMAGAFSEAGYYVASQANQKKSQDAIRFIKRSASVIKQIGNQSYPSKTNNLNRVVSEIIAAVPSDFEGQWPSN